MLALFAIDGNRWCVAAAPSDDDPFDGLGAVADDVAERLLCHEARRPVGDDPIGTLLAIEVGDQVIHVATAAGVDAGMGMVRVDQGRGIEHVAQGSTVGGGGAPFSLWSTPSVGAGAVAFEFQSPTGESEPLIVEAPEPVSAAVVD